MNKFDLYVRPCQFQKKKLFTFFKASWKTYMGSKGLEDPHDVHKSPFCDCCGEKEIDKFLKCVENCCKKPKDCF